jgi:hypothetical protein
VLLAADDQFVMVMKVRVALEMMMVEEANVMIVMV